ncbi:hypothetical protein FHS43_003377 [Streptosporangium becharense]|uniref:Uncharacterized protein n=1 Tax=Streptosporangium becharense TaxID=1816182 RepID=A0A7W9IDC5_9ACTN|nr:hypothetical protein [Streptosporangium becharense]MBB2912097.1 hypothetical protein [Streptosporangium becharense]MBB5818644.1 hypothetical protein [Streptosporangium becharense]
MTDSRKKISAFEERLVACADERSFKVSKNPTLYYIELEHTSRSRVVYLDRRKALLNAIAVSVSPESDLGCLASIPGLVIPVEFRHGSGMTRFPKRANKGERPIHYGYLIICADIGAYGRLLKWVADEGADTD